jgi:hypothetical protein
LGALTAGGVHLEIADVCPGPGGGHHRLSSWRSLARNARRMPARARQSPAFARHAVLRQPLPVHHLALVVDDAECAFGQAASS